MTSPGRQAANGSELLARLAGAAGGAPVRLLSAQEEARLAFLGAVSGRSRARRDGSSPSCDVGGGSAQVAVGTRRDGLGLDALDRHRLDAAREPAASNDDPPGDAAVARAPAKRSTAARGSRAAGARDRPRGRRQRPGAPLDRRPAPRCATSSTRSQASSLAPRRHDIATLYGIEPERVRTLAAGRGDPGRDSGAARSCRYASVRGGVREGAVLELGRRLEAA